MDKRDPKGGSKMANYRLDDLNRNQYQENRKVIAERGQQPLTAPLGNYSLDNQGRPILPNQKEMITDESVIPDDNSQSGGKVYYINDYTPSARPSNTDSNASSSDDYYEPSYGSANYRLDQMSEPPHQNIYAENIGRSNQSTHKRQTDFRQIYQKKSASLAQGLPQGKIKILTVYLLVLISMIWAGWQILPFNKVNHLLVQGHDFLTAPTILQGVNIKSHDKVEDVLDYRPELEDHILANHPIIEDVTISRDSWDYLTFTIKEHQIVGRFEQGNLVYPLLSNGHVMESPIEIENLQMAAYQNLPLIEGDFSAEALEKLGRSLEQIEPYVLEKFSTIQAVEESDTSDHIIVNMEDGNQIYAVLPTFAQKVNFYPNIVNQLEGRQGVIDLEVGAYFTPYSNSADSIKLNRN